MLRSDHRHNSLSFHKHDGRLRFKRKCDAAPAEPDQPKQSAHHVARSSVERLFRADCNNIDSIIVQDAQSAGDCINQRRVRLGVAIIRRRRCAFQKASTRLGGILPPTS
ncbi:unnamed protein product [Aphanomyces euteiches]